MEAQEELPDPFARRSHVLHPSLAGNRVVGADVDLGLFERFFQARAFAAWSSGTRSWQLHCYGEPGCGKTTIAAVAASRIPPKLKGVKTAVASISVRGHIKTTSMHFVEDLLSCIYDLFGEGSSAEFTEYQNACHEGRPVAERVQKLSTALVSALPGVRKFLIIDGYDRINEALQTVVDAHLRLFQGNGMRIMTTRRVPIYEVPHNDVCDECKEEALTLWWQCSQCSIFYLCYSCRRKEELETDHNCKDVTWREIYSHISARLGDFPIGDFVANNIKLYHPELEPQACQQIISYVVPKAEGNITLALLYLEHIFVQDDYMSLDTSRLEDRLPREVVAFFDAEMKSIEGRTESKRLPTLLAISVAAQNEGGIPLADLEECISRAQSALNLDFPRSAEDVFKASHGWLCNPHSVQREVDICCRPAFALYVNEDYNESLAWAKRQLESAPGHEETAIAKSENAEPIDQNIFNTSNNDTISADFPGSLDDLRLSPDPNVSSTPMFAKQKGFVMSPPRMDSVDAASMPTLPTQIKDISLSGSTDTGDSPLQSRQRICNFCAEQILNSGASAGRHHKSLQEAQSCVHVCTFCASLYSTDNLNQLSSEQWTSPLYHWTFRALPRGRELKRSMILKFWPLHSDLSAKSFHFLRTTDLHIPSQDMLSASTDPDESGGDQIKDWIDTCARHHAGCGIISKLKKGNQKRSDGFLPARLLDVDTGDDDIVRLIETKVTKVKGPYCTLSHAWGPPDRKPLMTTVWNMAEHLLNGIKMSDLPRNFQQAIIITRLLKVRYIWIDSLTIVQAPFGDFLEQGVLMHKVYRNSFCNIVAADSNDRDGGLFRTRSPDDVLPVRFRGIGTNQGLGTKAWAIVPADMWESELLNSFIYTRGWVFQERMLSPRLLHFTKHQIFWDCSSLSACEAFPAGIPFSLDHKASTDRHWRGRLEQSGVPSNALYGANDNESSYTFWMSAVQAYTDCNLTNQEDKTMAIWSAAKLLRDVTGECYAVGMWSAYLEEQLAWIVRDIEQSERPPELQSKIPSWSWASMKGSIVPQHRLAARNYNVKNHEGGQLDMRIKEVKDEDREPELVTRRLAIEGFLNEGVLATANGAYRLETPMDAIHSLCFDVFPDEPPSHTRLPCTFTILAASATPSFSAAITSNFSTSPNLGPITYSGVGLILTDPLSWYAEQDTAFRAFQAKEGNGKLAIDKEWRKTGYEKLLVGRPKSREKGVWRRIGAVHFQGLDVQAWNWLTKGKQVKFWIE